MNAVFPGTFDPPTNGHLNLIERASRIMDKVLVVVADNTQKKTVFSSAERHGFLVGDDVTPAQRRGVQCLGQAHRRFRREARRQDHTPRRAGVHATSATSSSSAW